MGRERGGGKRRCGREGEGRREEKVVVGRERGGGKRRCGREEEGRREEKVVVGMEKRYVIC